jgi:hypothetical protein
MKVEENRFGGRRVSGGMPPGAAMLAYVGSSALLLLLGVVAGAQCFRRRGLAFTGLLAGMVLFAGGLDYAVMRRHAARALDVNEPRDVRRAAYQQARRTFFHQAAAIRLLEPVAATLTANPAQPPMPERDPGRR